MNSPFNKPTEEIAITPEVIAPLVPAVRASESLQLALVAKKLWQSGLFPNVKSEAGAFAIVQYGREMNVPPMTSLQNISIIQGKPAINGNLMSSLAFKAGVRVTQVESDDKGCILDFTREGYSPVTAGFNEEDAKKAGLIRSGSGYTKYPIDMYYWRAMARGLRRIAPDVTVGLYTVEEITDGMHLTIDEVENELNKNPDQAPKKLQSYSQDAVMGEETLVSEQQLGMLSHLYEDADISDEVTKKYLAWRGQHSSMLTLKDATGWVNYLQAKPNKKTADSDSQEPAKITQIKKLEEVCYPVPIAVKNARNKYLETTLLLESTDERLDAYLNHMQLKVEEKENKQKESQS